MRAQSILAVLVAPLSALVGGCATSDSQAAFSVQGYRLVKTAGPCMPLDKSRDGPERHVEIEAQRAGELLTQVNAKPLEEPFCWYLRPDTTLRLLAGPFCGGPVDTIFKYQGDKWVKVSEEKMTTTCDPRG